MLIILIRVIIVVINRDSNPFWQHPLTMHLHNWQTKDFHWLNSNKQSFILLSLASIVSLLSLTSMRDDFDWLEFTAWHGRITQRVGGGDLSSQKGYFAIVPHSTNLYVDFIQSIELTSKFICHIHYGILMNRMHRLHRTVAALLSQSDSCQRNSLHWMAN